MKYDILYRYNKVKFWLSPVRYRLLRVNIISGSFLYLPGDVGCTDVENKSVLFFMFQKFFWRCVEISKQEIQINEEIRDKEVRVIDSNGGQLGIMSAAQALEKAAAKNLDLVKIAPQAVPPVCKIMDYGKYRFEQAKREKEARKNQHVVDIKEVRLSLNIDTHDFNTKLNHTQKFIKSGDKVKVSIRFRGREMGHPELGTEIMDKFAEACQEFAFVEKPAKLEGRSMLMFLAPKPNK